MFQHMVSNAQIHTQQVGEMCSQTDIQRQIYRQRERWKTTYVRLVLCVACISWLWRYSWITDTSSNDLSTKSNNQ